MHRPSTGPSVGQTARPARPWKLPIGLLVLDLAGIALLALGLVMQFEPGSALARALPPTLRLPLLIIGGAVTAIAWLGLVRSILAHRRGG
jgi:hypothetical protein